MPAKVSNEQLRLIRERHHAHISFCTGSVAHLIKVVCSNARLELRSGDVQNLPGQSTDLAHRLLCRDVQNIDFGPVETVLARRYARLGPVGALYGLWEGALGGKGIDGPHRTSEEKCREWIMQPVT